MKSHPCSLSRAALHYFVFFTVLMSFKSFAGFSVSGTQLLDANGQVFVMRGVNHPHAWYTDKTASIADIAAIGANTVRVVLSNGDKWSKTSQSEVDNIIALCKQNKLICVLEVHDTTGYGEDSAATTIASALDYWKEIKSSLVGQEDYIIINIANEPFGNGVASSTWVNEHIDAIEFLRAQGFSHTLMVDAASWGQDWEEISLNNAAKVAAADNLGNIIFSVHMYEVYQDYDKVYNYLNGFRSNNLSIVVGEFGADHQGNFVDAESIFEITQALNVGYLGWSWSGNSDCCEALDIVDNFNASNLTSWGERIINGTHGIKETSVIASVFSHFNSEVEYYYMRNAHSNMCMRVDDSSSADNANIVQDNCNDGWVSEQFSLDDLGNGYVHIKSLLSEKCLRAFGDNVIQYTCDNTYWSEMFSREATGDDAYIYRNRSANKCLRIENSSSVVGASIVLHECNTSYYSQRFVRFQ